LNSGGHPRRVSHLLKHFTNIPFSLSNLKTLKNDDLDRLCDEVRKGEREMNDVFHYRNIVRLNVDHVTSLNKSLVNNLIFGDLCQAIYQNERQVILSGLGSFLHEDTHSAEIGRVFLPLLC